MSDIFQIYSNLLAQEGINLEYSPKVSTASFDFKTRKITLPTMDYLDKESNQMMVAHEAGHAKYSKYTLEAVQNYNKIYGCLFNIIEDCYIEKCIKKDYPGLRPIFLSSYDNLHENKFFGNIYTKIDSTVKFVDRLNIHFKLGHSVEVEFTPEEKPFVSRIYMLGSNKEVIKLCEDIKNFLKEKREQEKKSQEQKKEEQKSEKSEKNSEEQSSGMPEESKEESEKESNGSDPTEESEKNPEEPDDAGDEENGENSEEDEESDDENSDDSDSKKKSQSSETDPNAENDMDDDLRSDSYEKMEKTLKELKKTASRNVEILAIDKRSQYSHICDSLIPLVKTFKEALNHKALNNSAYLKILDTKTKNIKNAAAAGDAFFKMKLTASNLSHAKMKKTGRIDSRTLVHYKTRDDIFKKNMIMPEQQNHGVIILMDGSGSISNDISNIFMQTAVLGEFCKRNTIPFEIYIFGASVATASRHYRYGIQYDKSVYKIADSLNFDVSTFLMFDPELRAKLDNKQRYLVPNLDLHNTPMDAAVTVAEERISDFKNAGIEKTHLFLITDGDNIGVNVIAKDDYRVGDYISSSGPAEKLIYKNIMVDISKNIPSCYKAANHYASKDTPFYIEKILCYIKKKYQTKITLCYVDHRQIIDRNNDIVSHINGKDLNGENVFMNALVCAKTVLVMNKQNKNIASAIVNLPWMDNVMYFTEQAFKNKQYGSTNSQEEKLLRDIENYNNMRIALSIFIKDLIKELA